MKFESIKPILYSTDVSKSLDYYVEKLGFENKWEWDSPPTFGGASRSKVEIFFCKQAQGNPGTWMSVFVSDIDEYYEEIKARGATILHPPETYEWGVREMLVEDPDGHKLRFGQNVGEIVIEQNPFTSTLRQLDFSAVKKLIETQPQWLKWAEQDGKNGLHYLCSLGVSRKPARAKASLSILQLLLEKGMDMNAIHYIPENGDPFPATPLWYAYARGKNKLVYTWLLENGAKPDNCMFAIAWQNDAAGAGLFRKHGAPITDAKGTHGPFLAALSWGKVRVARWFLENGAHVNFADEEGNTALHLAVMKKLKPDFVQLLLEHGADPQLHNKQGMTPALLAMQNGRQWMLHLPKGLMGGSGGKNESQI